MTQNNQQHQPESNSKAEKKQPSTTPSRVETAKTKPTSHVAKEAPSSAKRIIHWTIGVLVVVILFFCFLGYRYVQRSLKPLDPTSNESIKVKVPIGSTDKQIGDILQKRGVIRSGFVFNYYVKSKQLAAFKAGYYDFKPSMTLAQIATELQKGGSSTPIGSGKVLVREGVTADQIGDVIQKNTKFKKQDFLNLLNDQQFLNELKKKYPDLLSSAVGAKDVKYQLEGYLYPATYSVSKNETLKQLVEQMVAKENQEMQPYYQKIEDDHMSVQQALTLASLVEGEGTNQESLEMIAGVFENRLQKNMKLQTDVSVSYALGKHQQNISYNDLKANSPYNLYQNNGLGPGPVNNPPINAVKAVLYPKDRDKGYLYFVANMKTGKIYYTKSYQQHQENVSKVQKANGYEK